MLASFSLVVAMLIMIHSFRNSLDDWLGVVLPADLYARASGGASGWLDLEAQERLATVPAVQRVSFARFDRILLDPARPAVTLIARDLDPRRPDALPLVAEGPLPADGVTPAWISEAVRDLHGVEVGDGLRLPVGPHFLELHVVGVWRDYVRQGGAILLPRDAYRRATQDHLANEAWIWLRDPSRSDAAIVDIRNVMGVGSEIEIREPGKLRSLSLAMFDRTFAVTYALQFAALVIGLFGISVGTSAQAMARRREFGVLHHLGLSLRDLRTTVAIEGGITGGLGACAGALVGGLMSLVLIHVINRQSFHWSMEVHVPWVALVSLAAILACCSALVAAVSVRPSLGSDIVAAVKEDW
jgi:putative ABC transport system permease protein